MKSEVIKMSRDCAWQGVFLWLFYKNRFCETSPSGPGKAWKRGNFGQFHGSAAVSPRFVRQSSRMKKKPAAWLAFREKRDGD